MLKNIKFLVCISTAAITFTYCNKKTDTNTISAEANAIIATYFGSNISLTTFSNYANQTKPVYITKDNTAGNSITNEKATLGRVLFYDKNLSVTNTVSCGSCHIQTFAFSDTAVASKGVLGGLTGRHSMRLINTRFADEGKFFWDERAATLEQQTTMPIKDHAEMGFSGTAGRENFTALLRKLQAVDYYKELFKVVYNDTVVTEIRMQECLAQFVRSIQSFDSKYDVGRAGVNNDNANFTNFTAEENAGKNLFLTPPNLTNGVRVAGGLGCGGCHRAPEFDIDPNSGNNGVVGVLNATGTDNTNTKSSTVRDVFNRTGSINSPLMHNGIFTTMEQVINHYNTIIVNPANNNLDRRLLNAGNGQRLNATPQEVANVIAFVKTLSGTNVYTDAKWSNPFIR